MGLEVLEIQDDEVDFKPEVNVDLNVVKEKVFKVVINRLIAKELRKKDTTFEDLNDNNGMKVVVLVKVVVYFNNVVMFHEENEQDLNIPHTPIVKVVDNFN